MLNILKKYLNLNKYYNQKELFEESFLSHPNYPSIYAATESLGFLGIENLVVKIPKEQFVELPDTFLSIYKDELVFTKKEKSSVLIENEKGKRISISFEEFLKNWNQIILVIESNAIEANSQYEDSPKKWFFYLLPVFLLVSVSIFYNQYSVLDTFFLGTTLIGLLLSILILQEKLGITTEIGSKFCNMSASVSCDSVIKSKNGEIFNWLSFSDLPILFFGINFISILINPITSSVLIAGLSLISIPFLLYSIWVQKVKLKKWCLLCFAVSVIIFAQSLVNLFAIAPFKINITSDLFAYFFSSVLFTSIWFFVKPLLENGAELSGQLNSLKRFKRNFKIFKSLLQQVEIIDGFDTLNGIRFGNPDVDLKLTLFLSPSCGHCHKAFKDVYELFIKFPDKVSLHILFNVNLENRSNEYLSIVESLLIMNSLNRDEAKDALIDWHINNLSLKEWKTKWQVTSYDMLVNNQIQKQYDWCLKNKLNFTPVKMINAELFPDDYEIHDLKYFMNDFEDEKLAKIKESLKIV